MNLLLLTKFANVLCFVKTREHWNSTEFSSLDQQFMYTQFAEQPVLFQSPDNPSCPYFIYYFSFCNTKLLENLESSTQK